MDLPIKRALISVSDKTGLVEFAGRLQACGVEIVSTGGSSAVLSEAGIPVLGVEAVTGFPEIMDGRVKTLHPKIHGGILGKRAQHSQVAKQHGIQWIDLVVVNLYPFVEVIQDKNTLFEQALEQIDIGGPAMIRAAAKNLAEAAVVVDPADYDEVADFICTHHGLSFLKRLALAQKAFRLTAQYDACIQNYLAQKNAGEHDFPAYQQLSFVQENQLRYGENPHQKASVYRLFPENRGVLSATSHQGKELSYNNLVDANAAHTAVREFNQPACAIIKHANPCGLAVADSAEAAFIKAFEADSVSAFGGIVALNRRCEGSLARRLTEIFFEVIIAPQFSEEALACFLSKPNLRVLQWPQATDQNPPWHYQMIDGALLLQEADTHELQPAQFKVVTQLTPSPQDLDNLRFAWQAVKQVKSNAIVIANDFQTLGIGAGQVSRVDAVRLAIQKAGRRAKRAYLASDAFFPFKDSIEIIAQAGIRAIIQPGGSIRDQEVIAASEASGIMMVFTDVRCFKH